MSSRRSDFIDLRWSSFGGVNRLQDGTDIAPNELYDAQGVYLDARGNLRGCHEGTAVDTVGGTDNDFPALSAESGWTGGTHTSGDIIGEDGKIWIAVGIHGVTVGTEPDWSSVTDIYDTVTEGTSGYIWQYVGLDTRSPMERVTNWKAAGVLFSANAYKAGFSNDSNALVYGAIVDDPERIVSAVEFEEFLIVCPENEPARAYSKDYASNTLTQWDRTTGLGRVYPYTQVPYEPLWIYHEYYEEGTIAIDTAQTDSVVASSGVNFRGANGVTGYGAAMPINSNFTTALHYWTKHNSRSNEFLKSRGIAAFMNSTGNDYELDTIADAALDVAKSGYTNRTGVNYRAGRTQQQAFFRFPAVYNGRFCAVESRTYAYSSLNFASGVQGSLTNGSNVLTIPGVDVSGIPVGAELLIHHNLDSPIPQPHISKDYVLDDGRTNTAYSDADARVQIFTIEDVAYDGTDTVVTMDANWAGGSLPSGTYFSVRSQLTAQERRRIYFTGRAADIANGISADGRDFMKIEQNNNVIIGESFEGDITCLFPQNEYRLLIGLDSAIYEIVGDLPLDGTAPANFDVRRVVSGTGVYKDTAITISDDGQYVYFCSATDNGVYQLYGNNVTRIDEKIRNHPDYSGRFDTLSVSNKVLYCFDGTNSVMWLLDLITGAWTYTKRVNSGQDATGTLPALELSDGSYASNNLYPTGDAGVFAPYRDDPSEDDRALVCYDNGTNYALRSLNYEDHNRANLIHGVKVQTQFSDFNSTAPKRFRQGRVVNARPLLDDDGGSDFNEMQVSVTASEGGTTLTKNITPERQVANEYDHYRFQGTGGRGDVASSVTVGDGISAIGEIAAIEGTLLPLPHRSRG